MKEPISIDTKTKSKIYVYFYIPKIRPYNKSSSNNFYDFKVIKVEPEYYTTCPVNYVSDCEEKDSTAWLDRKNINYYDIEDGGYYRFEFPTQKLIFSYLDNKNYVYDITGITIFIEIYSNELYSYIIQESKILVSYNIYSDSQIPNKFK